VLPATASPLVRLIRRTALPLLAGLLLGLSGCGWLYNYEGQMASEQQRMERFDEHNEYLGTPLVLDDMPKLKDPTDKTGKKELDAPLVFLRPPLGITHIAETGVSPDPFLHFIRTSQRPSAKTANRFVYTDMYVWAVPDDGMTLKDFQNKAFGAFRSQLEGAGVETVNEHPLGRPQLVFSPSYRKPAVGLSLFLCQRNGANVAIAYKILENQIAPKLTRPMPDGPAATITVTDLSLESLGVGTKEAGDLKKAYDLRKQHQK
jgi:hypothetical protein